MSETKEAGRPTKYREEFCEQGRKLCLLGYTNAQLADFWDVAESTIYLWAEQHPEFSQALKAGKVVADADMANALFQRGMGFTATETQIREDKEGNSKEVVLKREYPPDTTAASLWLRNRQPALWRDKQEVEHSANGDLLTSLLSRRRNYLESQGDNDSSSEG